MQRKSILYWLPLAFFVLLFNGPLAHSSTLASNRFDSDQGSQLTRTASGAPCSAVDCTGANPSTAALASPGLTAWLPIVFSIPSTVTQNISVLYQDSFRTKKYPSWQPFGKQFIALTTPGKDAVVVRRGTTFSVSGPAGATLRISKSKSTLTTLTAVRNPSTGNWDVTVPASGTVGIYTLTMSQGSWSQSLKLYVIFELPAGVSSAFLSAFVYDDIIESTRDTSSIGYHEYEGPDYTAYEYTHSDFSWIPEGAWINHGYGWSYDTQHYQSFVFKDQVMPTINGITNTWEAANALSHRVDEVTCMGTKRVLGNSWCVLNPSSCGPDYNNKNQCSNVANLLTAFSRAAGIPARDVFTDWKHMSFDHSTEVWTQPTSGPPGWYVTRAYNIDEFGTRASRRCSSSYFEGGIVSLRSTLGWYAGSKEQGVYAAGETWNPAEINGGAPSGDSFRMASWDLNKTAKKGEIVKKSWWETRFRAYWGWPAEPKVIGVPPANWPALPGLAIQASPPPAARTTDTQPIRILRVVADSAVDTDKDGRYNQLLVKIQVDVAKAGRYWLQGRLKGGIEAVGPTDLTAGAHTVELPFEGQDIYMSKLDGPYSVEGLWATDVPDPRPEDFLDEEAAYLAPAYKTAAYRFDEFGFAGAALKGEVTHRAVDTDGDRVSDALVVEVKLRIDKPGTFTVDGVLSAGQGREPIRATWTGSGEQATLQFKGLRGSAGPYTLIGLSVRNAAQQVTDGIKEPLAMGPVPEFGAKPVVLGHPTGAPLALPGSTGGYAERAVDADGDGRFEQLVVTVPLQATTGQTGQLYRIEGWLADRNGAPVAFATTQPQALTMERAGLALTFQGSDIGEHGQDGPFVLVALKVLKGTTDEVLDSVDVAYSTAGYKHAAFK